MATSFSVVKFDFDSVASRIRTFLLRLSLSACSDKIALVIFTSNLEDLGIFDDVFYKPSLSALESQQFSVSSVAPMTVAMTARAEFSSCFTSSSNLLTLLLKVD